MSCHDDRPEWAVNLPTTATLDYVRALGGAALVVIVALWIVWQFVARPSSVVGILKRRVGG